MDCKIFCGVFIVLFALIETETLASNRCKELKNLDYELFGTKTNYDTARRHLRKTDDDDLPDSFDDDSIEKEHKDLLEDSCKPIVFYFFGRHAARFPDGEDIELYNKKLSELQQILRKDSSLKECDSINSFVNWTSKMQPKQDNLMTELGAKEERELARRFKSIYPEFFDTDKSDVKIGVTTKLRTAQTGAEFLKEVRGFSTPNCGERSIPVNDIDSPEYNLDKIYENQCYKTMMDRYGLPFLEFHKQCGKIKGSKSTKDPLVERVKNSSLVREVADRVAKKLGLPGGQESPIDAETLDIIFEECKFETALGKHSIWCDLFEKKDVKILEYIKDIDVYISNAYGPEARSMQACPLMKDLVENFLEGMKLASLSDEKRRSYFYFSHAGPMKKILAAFGLFRDDDSYTEQKIEEFITKRKIDDDRDWRSSLIVPFSANIAFVLYRCEKPGKTMKHKILATVTEQPVKLGKCKDTQCNSNEFFAQYNSTRNCDLHKICQ